MLIKRFIIVAGMRLAQLLQQINGLILGQGGPTGLDGAGRRAGRSIGGSGGGGGGVCSS